MRVVAKICQVPLHFWYMVTEPTTATIPCGAMQCLKHASLENFWITGKPFCSPLCDLDSSGCPDSQMLPFNIFWVELPCSFELNSDILYVCNTCTADCCEDVACSAVSQCFMSCNIMRLMYYINGHIPALLSCVIVLGLHNVVSQHCYNGVVYYSTPLTHV